MLRQQGSMDLRQHLESIAKRDGRRLWQRCPSRWGPDCCAGTSKNGAHGKHARSQHFTEPDLTGLQV